MDVSEFDFDLPPELIAQEPPPDRGAARLLSLDRRSGSTVHTRVAALPGLLRAGDLVVVNNTRVFPARLIGRRVPSGGAVECLLIRRLGSDGRPGSDPRLTPASLTRTVWEALMHPGQKLKPGAAVIFDGTHTMHGEVLDRRFHGRRVVRLWTEDGTRSTRPSTRSATCRCRPTSSATIAPTIATATRPSSRARADRWRRRPPGCISAAR